MAYAPPQSAYIGRFAPSPSGPLHAGSLLAAMASFLDARANEGRWLLRIEDIDFARTVPGADRVIMQQLLTLGMQWDGEPTWQSRRLPHYQSAFDSLCARDLAYGCACTRQELPPDGPYPGTCRNGLPPGRQARSWRFRTPPGIEHFTDRRLGPQQQDAQAKTGDFIIRRADGYWAYQLAVVVDDGAQGITDIVRGADLLELTACQRMLARSLGHPCPRVMHVPLLCDEQGRKLSKQNHASALDLSHTVRTLNQAWCALGFETLNADDADGFWRAARIAWARRYPIG
ncbi:MAG: tRNA glutamyl-Q(34) synthetase GluQRS [Alcaligenaceae bacterium]|nr:tRNA glutamyl-Q(34) synthetase GluQRS [Alcaligenaceae bacterium]